MFPEVVRTGTLSRGLNMQLCIGNAIELLQLLQAGIALESSEFAVLAGAAELFRSEDSTSASPASSAISDASSEMVSAVRAALAPSTTQDLQSTLNVLANALAQIAAAQSLDALSTSIEEVVADLSAIRHELAARGTVATDESFSQLTA